MIRPPSLRTLRRLLTVIAWPCEYCGLQNETSFLIWDSVKYSLICVGPSCHKMQAYRGYIETLDPHA